ncbi:hypothetical protein T459_15324 [Capsicum annuum]|uniref:Uncharacterized protein n=1 Tax=Capsicum annuum TaxID=4072 RepID=A0A2G2ZJZ6_CAPAN|nr:hypothetical protein T459_15324 [Capsicum annuum]
MEKIDPASDAAWLIEEEAFTVARSKDNDNDNDIEILEVYSKRYIVMRNLVENISKIMYQNIFCVNDT